MHAYKFKVTLEDQDNFSREIELRSNQSFEDFHNIMLECGDFDGRELASFFLCDSQWRKTLEITLFDMDFEENGDKSPNDEKHQLLTMNNANLKNVINDPHQRIMYVYDFLEMWTFYIELFKVVPADPKATYPRITKSTGKVIKKLKQVPASLSEEDEDHPLKDFEDGLSEDDDELISDDNAILGDDYIDDKF